MNGPCELPAVTQPPATGRESAVNDALTPKRRRRAVENLDYAAFARRVIRAQGRRVASGDIEAIGMLLGLTREIDKAMQDAINGLRSIGYSWNDIAQRLNITRQAAQQRWGTREHDQPPATYETDPDSHYTDTPPDDDGGDQL